MPTPPIAREYIYWYAKEGGFSDTGVVRTGRNRPANSKLVIGGEPQAGKEILLWELDVVVEICWLESRFIQTAHVTDADDDSWGLMQINMLGPLGPYRREKYNIRTNAELLLPKKNMEVAHAIFVDAGHNFNDWATFETAKQRLIKTDTTVKTIISNGHPGWMPPKIPDIPGWIGDRVPNIDPLGDIDDFFIAIGKRILDVRFWKALGLGALGVVILAVGFAMFNKDTIMSAGMSAATKGL